VHRRFSIFLVLAVAPLALTAQTGVTHLPPLPGRGMAQHPFLYCGEWQRRSISQQTMHIVREGKIVCWNPLVHRA